MSEENKPWLCSLAYVALYVKGAIEAGHASDITVGDVLEGIAHGTLLDMLPRKVAYPWDFALLKGPCRQEARVLAALDAMVQATCDPGRWPPRQQRTGLRFLMALLLAAMDQGYWTR